METNDPADPDFDLDGFETARAKEVAARAAERIRRDAAWRLDAATRWREKGGPSLAPSFVSVAVPDPAPGAALFVLVRDRRRDAS